MRDLRRNTQTIWYSLLNVSKEEDEWGNTVDIKGYSQPQEYRINVSANKGETKAQVFGLDLNYDREMTTSDITCPIDEYTHLWIDRDTSLPHNYEVVAVSKSLNSIRYAVRRVNVS